MPHRITRLALAIVVAAGIGRAFALSPTLFAVTRNTRSYMQPGISHPAAGLFATTDGGKNWNHLGWPYGKFFSVSARTLANGELLLCQACGNGVMISGDSGASWRIATGWDVTECLKTAIHPDNAQILYTATGYGIQKSNDGGLTWVACNQGLLSTFTAALVIDTDDAQQLFCATEAGIHRSRNGGQSWEPIGVLGKGIRTLIQHPIDADLFAAGTEDDGVFLSTDHGRTWKSANTGLQHRTVYALAFVPGEPETIFCGTYLGGIYRSRNLGKSWQAINNGLTNLAIHALSADPQNPQIIYAGTLGDGAWRSDNGGDSWHSIGLETSEVWDFHWLAPSNPSKQEENR